MYLWDSNILRHYGEEHPTLMAHLQRISRQEVLLPSVVVAEALRGRCDYALKATPEQAVKAHEHLLAMLGLLQKFQALAFDGRSAAALSDLHKRHPRHKRYALT